MKTRSPGKSNKHQKCHVKERKALRPFWGQFALFEPVLKAWPVLLLIQIQHEIKIEELLALFIYSSQQVPNGSSSHFLTTAYYTSEVAPPLKMA